MTTGQANDGADLRWGRYGVAAIDPPWQYNDKCLAGQRGAECKYPVLGIQDLKRLDVPRLLAPDAAVFLWATGPLLAEGLACLTAWGLAYKCVAFTWVKTSGTRVAVSTYGGAVEGLAWGMGHSTRSNAEFVLLGMRGRVKRVSAAVHSVVIAPRQQHSAKPRAVRERIVDLYGDLPRVELFARDRCPGWDAVGNEIDGRDIRDVLGLRPELALGMPTRKKKS